VKCSLLYYSDGIIAVHIETNEKRNAGRILAISTQRVLPEGSERLIRDIPLESDHKLFARHTSSVLYYGTHTGTHHEWEIHGVSLDTNSGLPPFVGSLELEEFYGSDLGTTVAFEIHDNYFYALSNQICFELEELDWTSFYHCIRFPLDKPVTQAVETNQRIYRRQHAEGPIHDSWTDLSIQVDEKTNKPIIVEARREWQNGSSKQVRAFYMTEITFIKEGKYGLPQHDALSALVGPTDKPNYAPWRERKPWAVHPEFGPDCSHPRSFVLSRTKFRGYEYSSSSYVDLVEDDRCCADSYINPCLRLRIGSRRLSPLDWMPKSGEASGSGSAESSNRSRTWRNPRVSERDEGEGDGGGDQNQPYRQFETKLWPPPASRCPCSRRLHSILSPSDSPNMGSRQITGFLDERTLVYMVKYGRSYGEEDESMGTVVVVNFSRDMQDLGPSRGGTQHQGIHQGTTTDSSSISTTHSRHTEGRGPHTGSLASSTTEWYWTPGQTARCKRGEC
jgi:hypothetical protein